MGEDQLPHLELTREVARKFDQLYCGVDPHTEDKDYVESRRAVPDHRAQARPREAARRHRRARRRDGQAAEDEQVAEQRDLPVRRRRHRAEESHGDVHRSQAHPRNRSRRNRSEKNPLWAFHETFNPRHGWVDEHQRRVRGGKVGDVVIKRKLIEVLNTLIEPIRKRRKQFEQRPDDVIDVLRKGTKRANAVAEETLALAKTGDEAGLFRQAVAVVLNWLDSHGRRRGRLHIKTV